MAPRLGGDFDLPTPIFENETRYNLYSLGLTETAPAPLGWIPDLSTALKSGVTLAAPIFPAALQQFIAFVPLPISAPTPTPPLSPPGHGDYPRHTRKKKSVRPAWDLRPDAWTPLPEESGATEVADADPVLATPVAPSGPIDVSGLQRLFNPPLAKVEAPAKKNRKARRAEARAALAPVIPAALLHADLLEDIDTGSGEITVFTGARVELVETDSGHAIGTIDIEGTALLLDTDRSVALGHIAIIARGAATEDADQLTATASWNDDDIALQFLLGDQ